MTGARVIDKDKTGQTQGFADLDQFQYKGKGNMYRIYLPALLPTDLAT